jgi:hypothetical protein
MGSRRLVLFILGGLWLTIMLSAGFFYLTFPEPQTTMTDDSWQAPALPDPRDLQADLEIVSQRALWGKSDLKTIAATNDISEQTTWQLLGIIVESVPEALIARSDREGVQRLRTGDEIVDGVVLRQIDENGIRYLAGSEAGEMQLYEMKEAP